MNYSELRNSTPYNSNTGDVTVIDFPLVRNARGNNDYVTAIDLIQFGKTTDFLKNNQEVTGWESTLNAIDTYFRQLNSAVETLSTRLDTIQTGLDNLRNRVDNYHQKETPTLNIGNVMDSIDNGGFIRIYISSNTPGTISLVTLSSLYWRGTVESTDSTTHVIKITNIKSTAGNGLIIAGAIKVNFTPTNTNTYNTVQNYVVNNYPITLLGAEETPVAPNYFYVGTTKPTSLSNATIVEEYIAEQTFTNNSTDRSKIYVLTNDDKTVTMYDPDLGGLVDQDDVDETTIPGCKIWSTYSKLPISAGVKIRIS